MILLSCIFPKHGVDRRSLGESGRNVGKVTCLHLSFCPSLVKAHKVAIEPTALSLKTRHPSVIGRFPQKPRPLGRPHS